MGTAATPIRERSGNERIRGVCEQLHQLWIHPPHLAGGVPQLSRPAQYQMFRSSLPGPLGVWPAGPSNSRAAEVVQGTAPAREIAVQWWVRSG